MTNLCLGFCVWTFKSTYNCETNTWSAVSTPEYDFVKEKPQTLNSWIIEESTTTTTTQSPPNEVLTAASLSGLEVTYTFSSIQQSPDIVAVYKTLSPDAIVQPGVCVEPNIMPSPPTLSVTCNNVEEIEAQIVKSDTNQCCSPATIQTNVINTYYNYVVISTRTEAQTVEAIDCEGNVVTPTPTTTSTTTTGGPTTTTPSPCSGDCTQDSDCTSGCTCLNSKCSECATNEADYLAGQDGRLSECGVGGGGPCESRTPPLGYPGWCTLFTKDDNGCILNCECGVLATADDGSQVCSKYQLSCDPRFQTVCPCNSAGNIGGFGCCSCWVPMYDTAVNACTWYPTPMGVNASNCVAAGGAYSCRPEDDYGPANCDPNAPLGACCFGTSEKGGSYCTGGIVQNACLNGGVWVANTPCTSACS